MFEFLAEKTISMLESKNLIVEDRAIHKYSIEIKIATAFNILLLLLVGVIFNCVIEVIIYEVIYFVSIKYMGDNYWTSHFERTSLYLVVFVLYLAVVRYLEISVVMVYIIIIISTVSIICPLPWQSNRQELMHNKNHRSHSLIAIIIAILCIVLNALHIPLYSVLTYSFFTNSMLTVGIRLVGGRAY